MTTSGILTALYADEDIKQWELPYTAGQDEKWKSHLGMRESIPRQVDQKARVPKEKKGIWGSQGGGKDKLFFLLYITQSQSHKMFFNFSFKPKTCDYTTNNSV